MFVIKYKFKHGFFNNRSTITNQNVDVIYTDFAKYGERVESLYLIEQIGSSGFYGSCQRLIEIIFT